MTKKIFKSNILVAAAVLIFGIACVMAILYQHFGKQINTELKKEATYLVYGVEENGIDYLKPVSYTHLKGTSGHGTSDGISVLDHSNRDVYKRQVFQISGDGFFEKKFSGIYLIQ